MAVVLRQFHHEGRWHKNALYVMIHWFIFQTFQRLS
jgi:hypothetical protein